MTMSLLFIDRIKMLCRDLVKGRHVALDRTQSYEVRILPSSMQRGSQQSPSSGLLAIKLVAAAPRLSAGANRLRWGNQRSSRDMEHTRSNLG